MPVLRDTWELKERLGKGSFGEVYRAVDVRDGTEVAIKMEERNDKAPRQLEYEYRVYKTLKGLPCIPDIHWFGVSDDYSFLVMEKLGPSLATLLSKSGGTLPEHEVAVLGILGIRALRDIHEKGLVHRDIKPGNVCLHPSVGRLYLIDYGLCKMYRHRDGEHIPKIENKRLTGTPRYCSMRTLAGTEQSRRDDVEGWVYCLLYFLRGRLPWQGIEAPTKKDKHKKILEMKQTTTTRSLVEGLRRAKDWAWLLESTRNLGFSQRPHYEEIEARLTAVI